jgi:hypothetical protein
MSDITAEDFQGWLRLPETLLYMEYVKTLRDDNDNEVHKYLTGNDPGQAAFHNAGMAQLTEILEVMPGLIVDNLKKDKNENP